MLEINDNPHRAELLNVILRIRNSLIGSLNSLRTIDKLWYRFSTGNSIHITSEQILHENDQIFDNSLQSFYLMDNYFDSHFLAM